MGLRRAGRQGFDGTDAVPIVRRHLGGELADRPGHPEPCQASRQQAKQSHQQQGPQNNAPQRFLPGVGRQLIKRLPLQNDIQVAAQLAVDAQRGGAEDFSSVGTARIVAIHRRRTAGEKSLHRRHVDTLALDMARRRRIGQQVAIRRQQIELHAGIKGHQSVKQRLQGLPVDLAVGVQQRLAGDNLLSQPGRQTLHHGVAILRAAV